ncbi:hypothetical protein NKJ72_01225 [Mesorhizobium sp. M0045]|uniref:hypothetical protein n=1 Tax=unclassified Mesorhizobium TaxID=325217 RepID=UPI00333533AE
MPINLLVPWCIFKEQPREICIEIFRKFEAMRESAGGRRNRRTSQRVGGRKGEFLICKPQHQTDPSAMEQWAEKIRAARVCFTVLRHF